MNNYKGIVMDWMKNNWSWFNKEPIIVEPKRIDVMKDDIDPNEVNIENAYKTRWIWYHTILAIGIFFTNVLLIAILIILAIKL